MLNGQQELFGITERSIHAVPNHIHLSRLTSSNLTIWELENVLKKGMHVVAVM